MPAIRLPPGWGRPFLGLLAREWPVEFGQHCGQFPPFGRAHSPQLGHVYHGLIMPLQSERYLQANCALHARRT